MNFKEAGGILVPAAYYGKEALAKVGGVLQNNQNTSIEFGWVVGVLGLAAAGTFVGYWIDRFGMPKIGGDAKAE